MGLERLKLGKHQLFQRIYKPSNPWIVFVCRLRCNLVDSLGLVRDQQRPQQRIPALFIIFCGEIGRKAFRRRLWLLAFRCEAVMSAAQFVHR